MNWSWLKKILLAAGKGAASGAVEAASTGHVDPRSLKDAAIGGIIAAESELAKSAHTEPKK